MRMVLALGGNALLKNAEFDLNGQRKRVSSVVKKLAHIFNGNEIAIAHGNGPQVGHILRANDYNYALDVADAETQAQIGYMLQNSLDLLCRKKAVTLVTRIVCAGRGKPVKPIGGFFGRKEYLRLKAAGVFVGKDAAGRGYRRLAFSPMPKRIIEIDAIERLLPHNTVISCGGGGIPVTESMRGIEGVIDKDYAASLLARSINAKLLVIATDVKGAALNFRKKNQEWLGRVSWKEALKHAQGGHFGEGSMLPKVLACCEFAKYGGKAAICHLDDVPQAIKLKAGTIIE
jgi:carbamate kinase